MNVLQGSLSFKWYTTWHHGRPPIAVRILGIIGIRMLLSCVKIRRTTDKLKSAPSMSTLRPIVCFHCLPARAIRRRRLSPSLFVLEAGAGESGEESAEALAALSIEGDGPEKNA